MTKLLKSPVLRMSFSLVMLTTCILLSSQYFGFFPDANKSQIQSRKLLVEMLATQIASGLIPNNIEAVDRLFASIVDRNDDLLSVGLRTNDKHLFTQYGEHEKHWVIGDTELSTPTHMQVPIYSKSQPWGMLELSFTKVGVRFFHLGSFFSLVIFVALSGLVGYSLFLRRVMVELDPGSVIPERVNNALNTLSEGLLIIDEDERVLFSNDFLMSRLSLTANKVLGKKASHLQWVKKEDGDIACFPWLSILAGNTTEDNTELHYKTKLGEEIIFKVKASQIKGNESEVRGVIITFSDITELDVKHKDLQRTLFQLKQGQEEIARQNNELKILASRDSLTGCLNRRSFFEGLKALIAEAEAERSPLTCIMVDIDHFKRVNDVYGHSVGDQVIKMVADTLMQMTRSIDLVGRYGGEEYCVVLPGLDAVKAMAVAERIRIAIMEVSIMTSSGVLKITSSFGLASLEDRGVDASEFVDRADQALYDAKKSGRNLVRLWSSDNFLSVDDLVSVSASTAIVDEYTLEINEEPPKFSSRKMTTHEDLNPVETPFDELFKDHFNTEAMVKTEKFDAAPEKNVLHTTDSKLNNKPLLPGRLIMYDRITQALERASRHKSTVAILVLNIEGVKGITNSMGSSSAEKFIQSIVQEIKAGIRNTDSLGVFDDAEMPFSLSQINSDELAVLLTDIEHAEMLVGVVERIFKALDRSVIVDGCELYLDSSIGISLFPDDGKDAEKLISCASSAMHEASLVMGKNNFRFSSTEIDIQANKRFLIQNALHGAADRREFIVHYQPQVDISTGNIVGMEALVRWQCPELGLINPDDFISVAESIGLIGDVTKSILSIVCNQLCAWRAAGIPLVPIAINLSPLEFKNENLAIEILETISASGLSPRNIEFEITENVVLNGSNEMEAAASIVQQLNEAGVSLSLDDFGTGYCSYNYLKNFPVQALKIDRSFISNFTDDKCGSAIVNSMISIAKNLDLKVVAEGVETKEQLLLLRDLQCDYIQGYLISKAVVSEEATKFLAEPEILRNKIMNYMVAGADSKTSCNYTSATELIGVLNNIR